MELFARTFRAELSHTGLKTFTAGPFGTESNDLPGAGAGGQVGDLYGVNTLITPLVGEDGNADKINGMYSPSRAIGYVEKWAIRPEMERDASLRGSEVVVTAAYAVGETDDVSGVRILSDGA